jgi:hypothetical protein
MSIYSNHGPNKIYFAGLVEKTTNLAVVKMASEIFIAYIDTVLESFTVHSVVQYFQ